MVDGGNTNKQTRISRSEARLQRSLEELTSAEAIVRRRLCSPHSQTTGQAPRNAAYAWKHCAKGLASADA